MSIERHEYSEINDILKSLRRTRLLNSRGIIQRTFKINSHQIIIQEESERSLRSSVSEIDECVCLFLGSSETIRTLSDKSVIELDSGCGLLGIICATFGASTLFTNPPELLPLLQSNVELNCGKGNSKTQFAEFDWGNDASKLCTRFFDIVLSASHILQNREEGDVEKIINNLVEVCGNGTTLILGYRVPIYDESLEIEFRKQLCQFFDLRHGRQVFYETPDGDIVIIIAARKPFVSFFEKQPMGF